MEQYTTYSTRKDPSFAFLVLSICCLSSRYADDSRLSQDSLKERMIFTAMDVMRDVIDRSDLYVVQGLFNLSVVMEGTNQPNKLWMTLSLTLS